MTTREIYFKALISSDLPSGMIGYVYKDDKGIIQIGEYICLELQTDKNIVEKSINKMNKVEKMEGFMFWNISPEGEYFFEKNWNEISNVFYKMILNQK